ncbi:CHAT domain-containing protein [Cyanobacterium aponinum 0216]|uniref:CHAT domain-containing protein n=2 Tax=Cyanobacterium TaxID=102234 RepID=A0A844GX77_9CHRO|nr:CHAT domain-containing protein [Cyanobacterium aponinum 0216]
MFFAGHSHTKNNKGIIFINPQERLTIVELKNALNKAIKKGLQLAIFNSCDGIGLAEELSKLNLPQIIVMREGVPDLIAQEFLKYFLSALQQNKSVFNSLREARERLQAWDKDFPGGSWLPMICQNLSTFNLEIKLQESLKVFPNLSVDFWHENNEMDLEDTIFYKKIHETNLLVKVTDITRLNVDIIVSSDDNYLTMGGGVSGTILRKAGKNIREETRKLAPIKLGDVAITNAGNLSAKYIFHAAVLDYQLKSHKPDIKVIQEVTKKSLKLAESVNAKSIAFPALATGKGGLAPEQSALGIIIEIIKALKFSTPLQTIIISIYADKNNYIKTIKSRFSNQISHFIDLYQQMETRYELLEDLENIFNSYNIELAADVIHKYQKKLKEIMDNYMINIDNK